MNPQIWGPPAWTFLHSITITYPHKPSVNQQKQYFEFFDNLKNVLPCEICKEHYRIHLKEYPLKEHLNTKTSLIKWLINIHNKINVQHGKREWTYDEVIEHYDTLYQHPNVKIKNTYYPIIIVLSIVLGACLIYIYKCKKSR
jgi:hypothetical protein